MRNHTVFAIFKIAVLATLSAFALAASAVFLSSCAGFPARESWKAEGAAPAGGLSVEIGADDPAQAGAPGSAAFRIRGRALEGAVLLGRATREGEAWKLRVERLDWFGNWDEGWTEASFGAEGELYLAPSGPSWTLSAVAAPRIGEPEEASIRLYGSYFGGEEARGILSRRWARIKATVELLKERFPDAGPDTRGYGRAVRAFLFPELYGYALAGAPPPARGHGVKVGEGLRWDADYSAAAFPEALREIRDSGTMLRDFEEGLGLWRLTHRWDRIWNDEIPAAEFAAAGRK